MCYKRGILPATEPATEHSQQAPFSDVFGELVQGIVLYCKTPVHWSSPSVQSNGPVHQSRVQVLHLPCWDTLHLRGLFVNYLETLFSLHFKQESLKTVGTVTLGGISVISGRFFASCMCVCIFFIILSECIKSE